MSTSWRSGWSEKNMKQISKTRTLLDCLHHVLMPGLMSAIKAVREISSFSASGTNSSALRPRRPTRCDVNSAWFSDRRGLVWEDVHFSDNL